MKIFTAIRVFAVTAIITMSGATIAEELSEADVKAIMSACEEQAKSAEDAKAFMQECVESAKENKEQME
jgi:glycerol-3-phosphate dehydrogenase